MPRWLPSRMALLCVNAACFQGQELVISRLVQPSTSMSDDLEQPIARAFALMSARETCPNTTSPADEAQLRTSLF